ncbi:hypothetical protein CPAV1605_1376 [seawater metagenome]|uniref:Uncharacterized protein n=1 Tax=seawater metagenome TaxID=1561972 RepID=A0A5E8CL76_9ZZZZ
MENDESEIITRMQAMHVNPISFGMKDLGEVLDEIEASPSFDEICVDKIISNFINWARKNSTHKFPRTNHAWENLIRCQFSKIKVHVDPRALYHDLDRDYRSFNVHFQILADRIKTFVEKPKNQKWSEMILMRKLRTFCNFVTDIPCDVIMRELYHRNLLKDAQINFSLNVAKRRRSSDIDSESDSEQEAQFKGVIINNPESFKRQRKL